MKNTLLIAAFAAVLSLAMPADAGLFGKCKSSGCDSCSASDCCDNGCCEPECCPEDYRCKCDVDTEPVEKSCYNIEKKPVCIPPITTSPFDCFKKKLCGGSDCCDGGCDAAGCCGDSCDGSGCGGCKKGGLFSCFKNKGCGKIRCVNKLSKKKYECGEECVYEWSAERVGCCDGGACCNDGCCDADKCCDSTCAAPGGCCPIR